MQGVIEREKSEQLQLRPLPEVFESLLGSEAPPPEPQPLDTGAGDVPADGEADGEADGAADGEEGGDAAEAPPPSPSPADTDNMPEERSQAASPDAEALAGGTSGRSSPDVAIGDFSFTFLGATFRCCPGIHPSPGTCAHAHKHTYAHKGTPAFCKDHACVSPSRDSYGGTRDVIRCPYDLSDTSCCHHACIGRNCELAYRAILLSGCFVSGRNDPGTDSSRGCGLDGDCLAVSDEVCGTTEAMPTAPQCMRCLPHIAA